MTVAQISAGAGAIPGSAVGTLLASLRAVKGVHSADKDGEFHVPPVDSGKPR